MKNLRKRQTKWRHSRFGDLRQLLRAVAIEGAGLVLLGAIIGVPLMNSTQSRISCLDARPSTLDAGLHTLLAKIGWVADRGD